MSNSGCQNKHTNIIVDILIANYLSAIDWLKYHDFALSL